MTIKIAVVVGSVRKESFNRQLAGAVAKLMPADVSCDFPNIGDLPIFNQDHDAAPPPPVVRVKEEIRAAQGVLFVTPEYNRSVPSPLKNVLDWGSRPYGQSVWTGKPAGVMGASIGTIGTAAAQQHLRNILAYLNMPTLAQPEVFLHFTPGFVDASGQIANEGSRKFLQGFVDRFVEWVSRHAA